MRSMTPGRLSRRRLRSGRDLLHPVSFLVGVGVSFLRSSGACLLVSFMGALMLGCCDCRIGLPRWFVDLGR